MKLFRIETDEAILFATGEEEYDATDKVKEYLKKRYFGRIITINHVEEVADSKLSNLPIFID